MKGIRGRVLLIAITVIASVIAFLPSSPLYPMFPSWWGKIFPSRGIVMGLDLQGGMHLVLEIEEERAIENTMERILSALKGTLEEKKMAATLHRVGRELHTSYPTGGTDERETIKKILDRDYPNLGSRENAGGGLVFFPRDSETARIVDASILQALETIRNRIDQFGVSEPLIQKQGKNQILVQLPGVKDAGRAVELIGKTALLEFKLVDEDHPLLQFLPDRIDAGQEEKIIADYSGRLTQEDQILFERIVDKERGTVTKRPYIVRQQVALTGDFLSDARVAIGEFNEPYVAITFDAIGSKLFEKITGENRRRRLAIILDDTVYSAPTIQDKISGGRAQITGSYTTETANDLSIILRAGSLPAPVKIIQNVTVGPSLGRDSVEKGLQAGVVGTLFVVVFMIAYYRLSGLLADFTMILNVILLIGALAAFNATLTLPGIAGIILTIGMSVDSNVLIFERIRDELRAGKPIRLAIDAGYDKAFSSIFDSHVTTLITAFVLFLFGTGPIKGFAVSLSLGVMINLFTSLVGTKVVFDLVNQRWKLKELSI